MTDPLNHPSRRTASAAGRMIGLLLLILALAPGAESLGEYPSVTDFVADLHLTPPLTTDATQVLIYNFRNHTAGPRGLQIVAPAFQPEFLRAYALSATATPLDRPFADESDFGTKIVPDASLILVSGVGRVGTPNFLPDWPTRGLIPLLPGEGYARIITFEPGWLRAADVPRINGGWLIIDATPPASLAVPEPGPDSVAAGRPLRLAPAIPVFYDRGNGYVPFHAGGNAAVPPPVAPVTAPAAPSSLTALVVLPPGAVPASGLVVTYLVGNDGSQPLWLWQNSLVPALAAWDIGDGAQQHATLDGSGLADQPATLPLRGPLLLNPGEYLSFQRTMPGTLLPAAGGTLGVRLNASWLPFTQDPDDLAVGMAPEVPTAAPQVMALTAHAALPAH